MRIALLLVAFAVLSPATAHANRGSLGLGLIVGSPTGVTGAYGLSSNTALDAAIGFDLINDKNTYLHLEFLYYLPTLMKGSSVALDAYLGIGGWVQDHNNASLGARAPFGLSLTFNNAPLEIFLELPVYLRLIDNVDVGIGGALGFRYYF